MAKFNWTAAFLSYAEGATLEEVAKAHNIPDQHVRRKAHHDRWNALLKKSASLALMRTDETKCPAKLEQRLAAIEANRAENLKQAVTLREHLAGVLKQLVDDELFVERQGKGGVVLKMKPGPQELVQLSTHARTVHELTYRALGDIQAAEKSHSGAVAGTGTGQAPAITIILPSVIAAPRAEREAKASQVIDLRPADVSRECQEQPAPAQVDEPKPLNASEPAADSSGL